MRHSLVLRVLGFVLALAGRTRWASLFARVWWLLPALKVARWWFGRRRMPVQRIRLAEGESITVARRGHR